MVELAKLASWSDALRKSNAPPGFTPIPGSKMGGFHKRTGSRYQTWYPGNVTTDGKTVGKTGIALRHPEMQDAHTGRRKASYSIDKVKGGHQLSIGSHMSSGPTETYKTHGEAMDAAHAHVKRTSTGKNAKAVDHDNFWAAES
jgi:hypothetical protein